MTSHQPSCSQRSERTQRGHELLELGRRRWNETTSPRWARPSLVPHDQLAALERDARADLLLVLVAARGLDDIYSDREDGVEGEPAYMAARATDPATASLLDGAAYACDKGVHLALTVADMAAAAPVAGGPWGRVPYGGGLYRPVLRWPAAAPATSSRRRTIDKRDGYRRSLEGSDVGATLAALASWFAGWRQAREPDQSTTSPHAT